MMKDRNEKNDINSTDIDRYTGHNGRKIIEIQNKNKKCKRNKMVACMTESRKRPNNTE